MFQLQNMLLHGSYSCKRAVIQQIHSEGNKFDSRSVQDFRNVNILEILGYRIASLPITRHTTVDQFIELMNKALI